MATEAQIKANKENSQKSTGPRTAGGKRVVSKNALKHGLCSHEAMVNGENEADYELRRDAFLGELRPVGVTESVLAERIVSASWRLRRAERMQNQAIDEMIEGLEPSPIDNYIHWSKPAFLRCSEQKFNVPEPKLALGRVAQNDYANDRVLDRLMMYERRIENNMLKIMRELGELQLMRRIEQADGTEDSAAQSRPAQHRQGNLKKQSQFASALMATKSVALKGYGDGSPAGVRGNKAKESRFRDNPVGRTRSGVASG